MGTLPRNCAQHFPPPSLCKVARDANRISLKTLRCRRSPIRNTKSAKLSSTTTIKRCSTKQVAAMVTLCQRRVTDRRSFSRPLSAAPSLQEASWCGFGLRAVCSQPMIDSTPHSGTMRAFALLLCFTLGACSMGAEGLPLGDVPPPDQATALIGLKAAASDAHLAEPVEVSDPIRSNPISSSAWLICLRSGKSEESKRLTYSAFFNKGYVSSHWSALVDRCGEQTYHALKLS